MVPNNILANKQPTCNFDNSILFQLDIIRIQIKN